MQLKKVLNMFKDFIYLFLDRGAGREKGRRETFMCGCLPCAPNWGPDPLPRPVPWLGIEPETFGSQWATPAKAIKYFFNGWKQKLNRKKKK